jgi:hypothetical protein
MTTSEAEVVTGLWFALALAWHLRCDGFARFACDPLFGGFPILDTAEPPRVSVSA